jgi:hypothetical protein
MNRAIRASPTQLARLVEVRAGTEVMPSGLKSTFLPAANGQGPTVRTTGALCKYGYWRGTFFARLPVGRRVAPRPTTFHSRLDRGNTR